MIYWHKPEAIDANCEHLVRVGFGFGFGFGCGCGLGLDRIRIRVSVRIRARARVRLRATRLGPSDYRVRVAHQRGDEETADKHAKGHLGSVAVVW